MKELTFEEFSELPMPTMCHVDMTRGWASLKRNDEYGIQVEIFGRRNKWGEVMDKVDVYLYLDGDQRMFRSAAECYLAYMRKACGVPE